MVHLVVEGSVKSQVVTIQGFKSHKDGGLSLSSGHVRNGPTTDGKG